MITRLSSAALNDSPCSYLLAGSEENLFAVERARGACPSNGQSTGLVHFGLGISCAWICHIFIQFSSSVDAIEPSPVGHDGVFHARGPDPSSCSSRSLPNSDPPPKAIDLVSEPLVLRRSLFLDCLLPKF